MRRKGVVFLGACIMLAGRSISVCAEDSSVTQVQEVIAGDINQDGIVNIQDLMMCLNHVSQKDILSEKQMKLADVDESGTVNIQDLMLLLIM